MNSLRPAIERVVSSLLESVHTHIPAVVNSFSAADCTVDATPSIKMLFDDGSVFDFPKIYNIPVAFMRTKHAAIYCKLNEGDSVILAFSESSLDEWLTKGKGATPTDPRRFSLTDAFAFPGGFPIGQGKQITDEDSLCLTYGSQTVKIKKSGDIEIGTGVMQAVVTEAFLNHTHSVTVDPGTHQGITNTASPPIPPLPEYTSSKVKVVS